MKGAIETASSRLVALDVLRGLAIAGMIVVTSPGDWNRTFAPLRHADWNGWTPTDMIFPAFLFGVGVALGLSFPRFLSDSASRREFWWRVGRRTIALLVLGLFLEATYVWAISLGAPFPGRAGLANVRIPGILQRIALCYALAAILVVTTARKDEEGKAQINSRVISIAIAAILVLYWALLSFVPVPGYGAGHLDPEGSLTAYIDRMVFTVPHLWPFGSAQWQGPVTYDPEGLLSSLPATANVLFGVLAAREWRRAAGSAALRIGTVGALLVVAGLLLDPLFPINKRLWTSSFAVLSSGVAAILLGALMIASRMGWMKRLWMPLRILGGNAILAFVLSTLLGRLYGFPLLRDGESPQHWINSLALRAVPDPYLASLACAIGLLGLVLAAIWPLHRRAIHLRL
jgi:predicted acyltransferase